MLDTFQIMVFPMLVVFGIVTVITQCQHLIRFFFFFMQYLSAFTFVFAKNGAKPPICSHRLVNACRILEQLVLRFFPFLHVFKFMQIVLGDPATIAC